MTCFAALFLGQAALRLAGAGEWSWLAPAVGLSVAMLVAAPAVDVPGGSTTVAILLGILTIAAAVWCLRSPEHRPPLTGLLAAAPVGAPGARALPGGGRGGILGVSVNNDMAAHLLIAEAFLSSSVTEGLSSFRTTRSGRMGSWRRSAKGSASSSLSPSPAGPWRSR